MVQKQIDVRAGREGSQAFQELMRVKIRWRVPSCHGVAQRADDAAVGEARERSLRERRAQKVSAESFEPETVIGADVAIGVEIEAFEVRVARATRPHPRGIGMRPIRNTGVCRPGRRTLSARGRRRR